MTAKGYKQDAFFIFTAKLVFSMLYVFKKAELMLILITAIFPYPWSVFSFFFSYFPKVPVSSTTKISTLYYFYCIKLSTVRKLGLDTDNYVQKQSRPIYND